MKIQTEFPQERPPVPATDTPYPGKKTYGAFFRLHRWGWFVLFLLLVQVISVQPPFAPEPETFRRLSDIVASGRIKMITLDDGYTYIKTDGAARGLAFEWAQAFAKRLGVRLEVHVCHRYQDLIPDLLAGKGDFIAAPLEMIPQNNMRVLFARPYTTVQPQLVVKRFNHKIKALSDLVSKPLTVAEGSAHQQRIEIARAQGLQLDLATVKPAGSDDLMAMVAFDKAPATLVNRLVFQRNHAYYPNIKTTDSPGKAIKVGWAAAPGARNLVQAINLFFEDLQVKGTLDAALKRYYGGPAVDFDYVGLRDYHRRLQTHLPRYEKKIKQFAGEYHLDWRWIVAQAYQESRFVPQEISPDGAYGLMQLTPKTAGCYGVSDLFNPNQSIRAGVAQLKKLHDFYDKAKPPNRLKIALAAYNTGIGHLLDARTIARKKALDPNDWNALAQTLPLLEKSRYYEKSQYGYCRGRETVAYVQRISLYYDILCYRDRKKQESIDFSRPPQLQAQN